MPSIRFSSLPALVLAISISIVLAACGGGSGGSPGPRPAPEPTPTPAPTPGDVQISGKVTYDLVPAVASRDDKDKWTLARLDYTNATPKPARGVRMEAVGDDGSVLGTAEAGPDGDYVLTVPPNTSVRLRAKAQLLRAPGNGPSWDFSIRDNTSPGYAQNNAALYAVEGEAFNSGNGQKQDLHAASGWTGSSYGKPRSAAPFAILDQFYSAMQKILAVSGQTSFAPMVAYWSVNNRPGGSSPSIGEIGTSHWNADGPQPGLYILGKENVDTDEFDTAVVVHEWGHYYESRFSRADSIGGDHGSGDLLDMRVAFGEGWGNSLAGMVRDDPMYVDTQGEQQALAGVVFDLNTIDAGDPRGWFNEASVQYTLYQMYKTPELGFAAIHKVMTGPQKDTEALTSLFTFATYMREQANAAGQAAIDQLLANINTVSGAGLDIWGSGQTYPAYLKKEFEAAVLPVYTALTPGQSDEVCTSNLTGESNKLGNNRYLRLRIAQAGEYKLRLVSGELPDNSFSASLFWRGKDMQPTQLTKDTIQAAMEAGDYVVVIGDENNRIFCVTATLFQ